MAVEKAAKYSLLNNSRFYILASSVLLSLFLAGVFRVNYTSDQLFYIRLEQVYGFLSIGYLYVAVLLSPLSKVVPGKPAWMRYLLFARRAIGVSSAYFATLHVLISVWGQIGGLSGVGLLPERFQVSFLFGFVALIILLLMAATSFDKVITFMTPKRWKLLHRLVYGGGILIILHVWMIGTHIAYDWVKAVSFIALVVFFALEAVRIAGNLVRRFHLFQNTKRKFAAALLIWVLWISVLLALPKLVDTHHSESHRGDHSTTQHEDHEPAN